MRSSDEQMQIDFRKICNSNKLTVISGGQTGVDRMALDVAMELGIPVGGWCPKGRRASDGRVPDRYPLIECRSSEYPMRTIMNVQLADATFLMYYERDLTGGTLLTMRKCLLYNKRIIRCQVPRVWHAMQQMEAEFHLRYPRELSRVGTVLNVAGPHVIPPEHRLASEKILRAMLESWAR